MRRSEEWEYIWICMEFYPVGLWGSLCLATTGRRTLKCGPCGLTVFFLESLFSAPVFSMQCSGVGTSYGRFFLFVVVDNQLSALLCGLARGLSNRPSGHGCLTRANGDVGSRICAILEVFSSCIIGRMWGMTFESI